VFPQHVLVATDGSEASIEAARVAGRLACASGGRATVLSVVLLPPSILDLVDRDAVEEVAALTSRELCAGAVDALRAAGVEPAFDSRRTALGIANAIADAARELGCDLIAVGATGASRALLGSVPARLASVGSCPVLVVPAAAEPLR
jgi:nucleotide-binding universal stress UspA family protein